MRNAIRMAAWILVPALAGGAAARADDKSELEALVQEVRKERAALAAERADLAEQRRRVDDALAELEHERVQRTPYVSPEGPGVSAAPEEKRPYVDLYGFAMVDAIYDFNREDPNWKSTLRPSKLPVNCGVENDPANPLSAGCGKDGEAIVSVKQSRLGARAGMPTPLGELFARVEFDFFATGDDAGETNIRLRHAYGELGPLLGGQTNSVFMDVDVFPNVIDYWGPAGMVFFRNPQIRYTPVRNENLEFALAIESPGNAVDQGKVSEVAPELDVNAWNPSPDFTTHVKLMGDWGHVQAAGILRVLGFDTSNTGTNNPSGTEMGYGLNLSSVIDSIGDDQLLLQIVGGRGIASYMNDGGVDLAPSNNNLNAAEALPLLGWLAYYNRYWNDKWSSSVGFSETRQWTTDGQNDKAFETGQYFSGNVLYHPVPQMLIGPEFLWGRLEARDGTSAVDNRVQFSIKYDFDGRIWGADTQR
ncbi:MAG TPA: DcaP family trimeric outer membrane transporter [Myxococcota bacterium]|nr:DcaP family trimeric outer membrane transporter [Myxococcota bacterium]